MTSAPHNNNTVHAHNVRVPTDPVAQTTRTVCVPPSNGREYKVLTPQSTNLLSQLFATRQYQVNNNVAQDSRRLPPVAPPPVVPVGNFPYPQQAVHPRTTIQQQQNPDNNVYHK